MKMNAEQLLNLHDQCAKDVRKRNYNFKRHIQPVERSFLQVAGGEFRLKKHNRNALFDSIRSFNRSRLTVVQTNDRSGPRIGKDVTVGFWDRGGYLRDVLDGVKGFYTKVFDGIAWRGNVVVNQSLNGLEAVSNKVSSAVASTAKTLTQDLSREFAWEKWSLESRTALFADIEQSKAKLHHVRWRNIHDRSQPAIPTDYKSKLPSTTEATKSTVPPSM